jgi:hypothetical protein
MKEYITLTSHRPNNIVWNDDLKIIIFYKDSNLSIIHREKDKPAVIYSGRSFSYHTIGKLISSINKNK